MFLEILALAGGFTLLFFIVQCLGLFSTKKKPDDNAKPSDEQKDKVKAKVSLAKAIASERRRGQPRTTFASRRRKRKINNQETNEVNRNQTTDGTPDTSRSVGWTDRMGMKVLSSLVDVDKADNKEAAQKLKDALASGDVGSLIASFEKTQKRNMKKMGRRGRGGGRGRQNQGQLNQFAQALNELKKYAQ